MPTILEISGWRLFFYSNESHEPMHIHARKAGVECKFWLDSKTFDVREAFSYGLKASESREIRRIIFDHFDYITERWQELKERR